MSQTDRTVIPVNRGEFTLYKNGLVNTSSACYLNVVLQTLVHTPGVKDYFLYNQHREDLRFQLKMNHESLAERFGEFVKTYYAFNGKVLNAFELKDCIAKKNSIFDLKSQEDAHEFLLFMVEHMGQELNR
jgi:ubiquitin C-terminal hydrolase